MPKLSKKQKQEWALFIHPQTKRRTYNELCKGCIHTCKHSFWATVVECRRYVSKRAEYYAHKKAPNQCKNKALDELRETMPLCYTDCCLTEKENGVTPLLRLHHHLKNTSLLALG